MADTMGTKEASDLWGIPQATITRYCREGKIKGAEQFKKGSPWQIPRNAECPDTKGRKGE